MISFLINKISGLISKKNNIQFIKDLKKLNFKIKILFDIGAHKGEYSDLIIKEFPKLEAHLFEPLETFFRLLKKKYDKNKNIHPVNKLVGNINKNTSFYISHHPRSSSKMKLNIESRYYKIKKLLLRNLVKKKITVKQICLDNYLKKIRKIDLLKIDVEGNELDVLFGCKKLLEKKKINSIYIEILHHSLYKNYSKKKIHNFLVKNNFILYKRYKTQILFQEDRLYVRKKFI